MKSNENQNGVDLLPNVQALPTPPVAQPESSNGAVSAELGAAPCSASFSSESLKGPWDGTSSYTEIYEYEQLPESPKKGDLLDGFINIVFDGDKCSYSKSVGGVIAL